MPLRDIVDMILARRLRRQEQQIRQHELTASWKGAILTKDIDTILRFLKEGADPNVQTEDGWTALELVTLEGRPDAINALASAGPRGVDINVLCHDGRTAVEVSALKKDWKTLESLLRAKANINITNKDGKTALEVASLERKWAVVEGLVRLGADVNIAFTNGRTALEVAANYEKWDIVRCLVSANPKLNMLFKGNSQGASVLHSACAHENNSDIVHFLLEKGADPNLDDGVSGSPLRSACEAGALDSVRVLLDAGVDTNRQRGESKLPLQAACSSGSLPVVELLLTKGADPNLQIGGMSPLQTACANGFFKIVKLLLEKGANPNPLSGENGSALQTACSTSHQASLKIVRLLLKKGADPNAEGERYGSPLEAACRRTSGGEYGSPLQAACNKDTPAIVEALLEGGANPDVKGGMSGTPLHSACALMRVDVIKILLKHRASAIIKNDEGLNAIEFATALMQSGQRMPQVFGMIGFLLLDSLKQGGGGDAGMNAESVAPQCVEAEMDSIVSELFHQQGVMVKDTSRQYGASVQDIGEDGGGGGSGGEIGGGEAVKAAGESSDESVTEANDSHADRFFRSEYGVTPREAWAFVCERLPPGWHE